MNNTCTVSQNISKYADEPEQISAAELFRMMQNSTDQYFTVGNQELCLLDISDKLVGTEVNIAAEESITINKYAVEELYVKVIKGLMDD